MCPAGREIMITKGAVLSASDGTKYLVEPYIRDYTKFTSNGGWINDNDPDAEAMEAFSHFTYHRSGGSMIVCDLQGRHKWDYRNRNKYKDDHPFHLRTPIFPPLPPPPLLSFGRRNDPLQRTPANPHAGI